MKSYEKEAVRKEILQCLKKYFYVYKDVLGRENYQIKTTIRGKDIEQAMHDSDDCSDMFLHGKVGAIDFTECNGEWFYHYSIPVSGSDILNGLLYKACYCISPDCYTDLEFSFEFDRNLIYLYSGYEWMYDLYIVQVENGYRVSASCHFSLDLGKFLSYESRYLLHNDPDDNKYKYAAELYDFVKEAHKFEDCFVILDSCGQLRTYTLDGAEVVMLNAEKFSSLFKSIAEERCNWKLYDYYCFFLSSERDKLVDLQYHRDSVVFIG